MVFIALNNGIVAQTTEVPRRQAMDAPVPNKR